jgi:hypothetical protein
MLFAGLAILGGAAVETGNAVKEYSQQQQALVDAKKDFGKGETAVFADFQVKANSVQRGYVPSDGYTTAADGKELVVVNVSVKNIGTETKSFSSYDLSLNADGVANTPSYQVVDPEFTGGDLSPNATASGNIVYEITQGATGLKLQHQETVLDLKNSKVKTLTYTLGI